MSRREESYDEFSDYDGYDDLDTHDYYDADEPYEYEYEDGIHYHEDTYAADEASYLDSEPIRELPAENGNVHFIVAQAFDWGISGSILAILLLTVIYVLATVSSAPQIIPAGDEPSAIAAVLAGGTTLLFLTILRFTLHSRVRSWGCLLAIVMSSASAFAVFWLSMQLFDRAF